MKKAKMLPTAVMIALTLSIASCENKGSGVQTKESTEKTATTDSSSQKSSGQAEQRETEDSTTNHEKGDPSDSKNDKN